MSTTIELGVIGLGAVGARAARSLVGSAEVGRVAVVDDDGAQQSRVLGALGSRACHWHEADPRVVVLATPAGTHLELARRELRGGRHVVSTSDDPDEIEALADLAPLATEQGAALLRGVAMSPGLSCVLARHASGLLSEVVEVDVEMLGAAGPSCADRRARALTRGGVAWRDGQRVGVDAGSDPEVVWFPDPIGARTCVAGALAEPLLLHELFPGASRLRARTAIEPAERWVARFLPSAAARHDQDPGAVRVEVWGRRDGRDESVVYAVMDRPSVAAATTAAVAARLVGRGVVPPGVHGLAEVVEPVAFLSELARLGVRAATFERAA